MENLYASTPSDRLIFYEKEMVHTDVIVGEISCQQKFFLTIFFASKNPTFELGFSMDLKI